MRSLQQIIESVLDADFDITEDDIKPLKDFAREHRAKNWHQAMAGNNINGEFLDIILTSYGEMIGNPSTIEWDTFLADIIKSKDSFMVWRPNINMVEIYTCDKPRRGKDSLRWTLHTQNPRIMRSSWQGPDEPNYRDEGIISQPWNDIKTQTGKNAKVIRLYGRKALDEIIAGLKE